MKKVKTASKKEVNPETLIPFQVMDVKATLLQKNNRDLADTLMDIFEAIHDERGKPYGGKTSISTIDEERKSGTFNNTCGLFGMLIKEDRAKETNDGQPVKCLTVGSMISGTAVVNTIIALLLDLISKGDNSDKVKFAFKLEEISKKIMTSIGKEGLMEVMKELNDEDETK